MVPEGWVRKKFGDIVSIGSGQVDPTKEPYVSAFHIGPENIISNHGNIKNVKRCSELGLISGKYKFDSDSIIYSKIRPNLNKVCAPDFSGVCSADMYPLWPNKEKLDKLFLLNLMLGEEFLQRAVKTSIRTGMPKINRDDLTAIPILLPPIGEQKKIAKILTTWDKAIETTEMLIKNAKAQKKALMQQLLTGKKRFPGFEGEVWQERALDEVAKILPSNVDKKSYPGETEVRLCNYTDVYYHSYITGDMDFMKATAKPSEIDKFSLFEGDVIITKDSEAPDDIAVPALVDEDLPGIVCGYHLTLIRPDQTKASGAFLANLFSLDKVQHYFFTRANGATRFGLSVEAIAKAKFVLPSLQEQKAIASIIRKAEQEIKLLEKQLSSLRGQKKALMQQLLTGKRRVKLDGGT